MKTISVRELNRSTARIVDGLENGESFELVRNGQVVGYISRVRPTEQQKPDWDAHFQKWRKRQREVSGLAKELEEDRLREQQQEGNLG